AVEKLGEAIGIAGIPDDEVAVEDRLPEPRRQIVENDDLLAGLTELPHDVRADVAGAPSYQNCFLRHRLKWGDIISTHEFSSSPRHGPEQGRSLAPPGAP